MLAIRRLHVDQDLVLAIALGEEVERRLVGPTQLVSSTRTTQSSVKNGSATSRPRELMLVVVVAVVEVEPIGASCCVAKYSW